MSFAMPEPQRELIHTRTIALKGYRRADGLFDVEGHLQDIRTHDLHYPGGVRPGGEPIHTMRLRLTVDTTGLIVDASAHTEDSPYGQGCASINPAYQALVGVRVGPGFRSKIQSLFGGLRGCTHLTELLLTMGTGVIQTLAGQVKQPPDKKPFSVDGCHALDSSGPIVAKVHPRWYLSRKEA